MKVIHLISGGDSGGAKTHVHSLLQELNQTIQADMVCFTAGPFAEEAQKLGINVQILDNKNIFAVLNTLKSRIISERYDIIHCHGSRANLMGALLHKNCQIPVVTTVHSDPELDYMGRFFARATFGTLNHLALHHIPYHIGVSDAMTDTLIERGIVKRNFFSIYNGIRFNPVQPTTDRLSYLRALGAQVDKDSVVIGIAARLNPVKDMSTLLRGFAAARIQCARLRLIIAGDGEELEMLKKLSQTLGIEQYVTFAGWISGCMDLFYSALDINVLTSLSETFPYALTDGTRFQLATVASKVGGIPNLIDDNVNGFLFMPRDWEDLGKKLAELGNNDKLRQTFGQRLYEKASTKFSIDTTIDTQLSIYNHILDDWRRRKSSQRCGAVICGSYGRGNAGDEAILSAIIAELRTADSDIPIRVMTRRPKQTRLNHHVEAVYTFNFFAYRKMMRRSTLYINGGGSLIQDVTSRRSLQFYLSTLYTAKKAGCKVMMYGCGIGPLRYKGDQKLAAKVINRTVDVITLRDQDSLHALEEMHVTSPRILLAADPTVNLPPASNAVVSSILEKAGLTPGSGEHYLGISLRPWPGFDSKVHFISEAVEHICKMHNLTPVFIPIEPGQDIKAATQVADLLTIPYVILPADIRTEQTMALFSKMDVVLSMRLHALIFSAVHSIPLVGIVYDPKVSSFLDSVDQDLYIQLADLDSDTLIAHLSAAVTRIDNRNLLESRSNKLRELERSNLLYAQELLKGDPQ